jgi:diguanylate cyclase (GGDEF)-like protein
MPEPPQLLVVDDDPFMRLLITEALRGMAFETTEADCGEACLALFNQQGADAVLLDVMMPGMNGFEACEAIRKLPHGEHTPVLIMTGLDDLESITRAFDAGATDFITKPINFPLLGHRVRYALKASDTTRRFAESERRLHRLAYFDSLTGLPNRQFFKEHLQRMVARAERDSERLGVLFLDVDGFKRINDTLGHHLGDRVLKATAERLRQSLCDGGVTLPADATGTGGALARLGGDEFTVLLSIADDAQDAAAWAERIRTIMGDSLRLGEQEVYATTSVGIAVYPDDGTSADELLRNADLAMYYAKRGGGNMCRCFSPRMTEASLRRLTIENHLRKAIERDELSLHYQPQIGIAEGEVCGVEALLRWRNPELGSVSPADFVPLAEETGLIVPIGEWVLREACLQARLWRDQGLALPRMAVNVSAVQFMHKGFPDLVARVLEETKLEPAVLELELTESALVYDAGSAAQGLGALKQIGVQLAIDDFGTGYSSLSRLKQFPIDRLKIDRSFVRDIETDAGDAAIAVAVIAMAGSMDLKVVAEGVETRGQLDFLREKHCDEVQGYFLSKPLPAPETAAFLATSARPTPA